MKFLTHIGYPKAASTLLQSTLFSGQHPKIKPLLIDGTPASGYHKSGRSVFYNCDRRGIYHIDPFEFDCRQARSNIIDSVDPTGEVACLSNETWSGHPYSGGVTGKEISTRIHSTLPETKILIVVRNQVEMIFSSYVQYIVHSRGFGSIEDFLYNNKHQQVPFHRLGYYEYHKLARHYIDLFGEDNVLVLPFETLQKEGRSFFFEQICDFVGVSGDFEVVKQERNAASYREYVLLRKVGALNLLNRNGPIHGFEVPRLLHIRPLLLSALKTFVSQGAVDKLIQRDKDSIKKSLVGEMLDSNKKLQKYCRFDLKSYGYDLF